MRFGIDARELAARPTGVGRYLAELLARWTRVPEAACHTLVLFSPAPLPSGGGWRGTGGATLEEIVVTGAGGSLWEQGALAAGARRARLQAFFAPGYTAPLVLPTPIVVAMHDVSFAAHPEWFRRREGWRLRVLATRTARRAARVLTLTAFSRAEIVRHLGVSESKVAVIPPAVDAHPALRAAPSHAPATRLAEGRGEPLVLYVGSIFGRRHVPELIEAFGLLVATRPDLRLVLVGDDRTWPPQRIGALRAASPAAARIAWHRWLDESALDAHFRRARAFAFLSEYEGFGLTPLEGLRAGVPPVVADVAVAHEAYGEAALFTSPRDPAAIAGALARILEDGPDRARVLAAAPGVLGRYSWDTAARDTLAALVEAGERPR